MRTVRAIMKERLKKIFQRELTQNEQLFKNINDYEQKERKNKTKTSTLK